MHKSAESGSCRWLPDVIATSQSDSSSGTKRPGTGAVVLSSKHLVCSYSSAAHLAGPLLVRLRTFGAESASGVQAWSSLSPCVSAGWLGRVVSVVVRRFPPFVLLVGPVPTRAKIFQRVQAGVCISIEVLLPHPPGQWYTFRVSLVTCVFTPGYTSSGAPGCTSSWRVSTSMAGAVARSLARSCGATRAKTRSSSVRDVLCVRSLV